MSMRMNLEQIELIQPTVGGEFEFQQIGFLAIEKRTLTRLKSNQVLTIISETPQNKNQCVQDDANNFDLISECKRIAKQENLKLGESSSWFNIFEFFTPPTKNLTDLNTQFEELCRIESHLIEYLVRQKQLNPQLNLVNVKEWIDHYNDLYKNYPERQLPATDSAKKLYILVDLSIHQLKLTQEECALYMQKHINLSEWSRSIQARTKHYVQFNFVACLGRNMGSMLIKIFEKNNQLDHFRKKIAKKRTEMKAIVDNAKRLRVAEEEIRIGSEELTEAIDEIDNYIKSIEKKSNILREAEINAKNACDFIRLLEYGNEMDINGDLFPLEGFFFVLSMRILTETQYISVGKDNSVKNKYHFYLKTKLSHLKQCLSESDRKLLEKLRDSNDKIKNALFEKIAGSKEALAVRLDFEDSGFFLIKDVIESTLGWLENDSSALCDIFPNTTIKEIDTPFEPQGMRSNPHESIERILFEYRSSKHMTLLESKEEMEKLLQCSALLCKTTYLHKQDGLYLTAEQETKVLPFENPIDTAVEKTIQIICDISQKTKVLESIVSNLFDMDRDIYIKRLNYLFLRISELTTISDEYKKYIQEIIVDINTENLSRLFTFPSKTYDIEYISYILERYYPVIKESPKAIEYLKFCKYFTGNHSNNFSAYLIKLNNDWIIRYVIKKPDKINQFNKNGFTPLTYGCYFGLTQFVNFLLDYKVRATRDDMYYAYKAGILTVDLFNRLKTSGAYPEDFIGYLGMRNQKKSIVDITKMIGKEILVSTIDYYLTKDPVDLALVRFLIDIKREIEYSFSYATDLSAMFSVNKPNTLSTPEDEQGLDKNPSPLELKLSNS